MKKDLIHVHVSSLYYHGSEVIVVLEGGGGHRPVIAADAACHAVTLELFVGFWCN